MEMPDGSSESDTDMPDYDSDDTIMSDVKYGGRFEDDSGEEADVL
jgi:hypothetical protein